MVRNSGPLFDSAKLFAHGRSVYPKKIYFSEILPLCSKNRITQRRQRPAGSSCTQELQALFSCLKKWEFDDKPCVKQHQIYMQCVNETEALALQYKRAAEKVSLFAAVYLGSISIPKTKIHPNNLFISFPPCFLPRKKALFVALRFASAQLVFDCKRFARVTLMEVVRLEFLTAEGSLGEESANEVKSSGGGSLPSSAQLNRIMTLFPQPDLGQSPYRQMKRMPSQSYADDIFHRKHVRGKKS
ncbi:unnamed protein product [Anisakis simplex]|uniref:CHCH domain-containing protein n=1 Tax=Anisakis simplex TaxID=6269 RepID=A0A0M3IY03_ANISI|nr:unnamed protein product [Anisakis simplex]